MWGLYRLWVLPTLELAFGMDSSKVLYQSGQAAFLSATRSPVVLVILISSTTTSTCLFDFFSPSPMVLPVIFHEICK